mmetsp:Transcript_14478/g.47956  ORF Transcript_14478/g.47956 Transcript_14478/m.47956 type:complete len:204 (+) Transcript_14478:146-757(+)
MVAAPSQRSAISAEMPSRSEPSTSATLSPKSTSSSFAVASCASALLRSPTMAASAAARASCHESLRSPSGGGTVATIRKPAPRSASAHAAAVSCRWTQSHFSPPLPTPRRMRRLPPCLAAAATFCATRGCCEGRSPTISWTCSRPNASHERSTAARLPLSSSRSSTSRRPAMRPAATRRRRRALALTSGSAGAGAEGGVGPDI